MPHAKSSYHQRGPVQWKANRQGDRRIHQLRSILHARKFKGQPSIEFAVKLISTQGMAMRMLGDANVGRCNEVRHAGNSELFTYHWLAILSHPANRISTSQTCISYPKNGVSYPAPLIYPSVACLVRRHIARHSGYLRRMAARHVCGSLSRCSKIISH
jgi:hypothetical protein